MAEFEITLDTMNDGRIAERFAEKLAEARDYIEENVDTLVKHTATITVTVDVVAMVSDPSDPEIDGWTIVGHDVKLKLPERRGKAQRVRTAGSRFVADSEEMDEHGTRRLPFPVRG